MISSSHGHRRPQQPRASPAPLPAPSEQTPSSSGGRGPALTPLPPHIPGAAQGPRGRAERGREARQGRANSRRGGARGMHVLGRIVELLGVAIGRHGRAGPGRHLRAPRAGRRRAGIARLARPRPRRANHSGREGGARCSAPWRPR